MIPLDTFRRQEMALDATPPHFTTVEKISAGRESSDTSWGHAGRRGNRNRCDSEKASEAFWDIFGCSNTFRNRSRILNLCRSRRSAPHLNEYFIIHLPSFESLSSSYATTNSALALYIFWSASQISLQSIWSNVQSVNLYVCLWEKSQNDVLSYSSEDGGGGNKLNTLRALTWNAWLTSRCGWAQQSVEDDGDQQQGGSSEHDACRVGVQLEPQVEKEWSQPGGNTCWVSAWTHVVKGGGTPYGNILESYCGIIWTARLQARGPWNCSCMWLPTPNK